MSRHVLRTVAVDLQALMLGYTVAFTGSTLKSMLESVRACPHTSNVCALGSLVASVSSLAATVSSTVSGRATDALGRRKLLALSGTLWAVGYATQAAATDVAWLLAGRSVAGLAMGMTSVVVPVYVSETAPPEVRGRLGALFNVFISTGILLAFLLGLVPDWWRFMAFLGLVPALLNLGLMACTDLLPETPRWLALHGRETEGRAVALSLGPGCEQSLVDDVEKVSSSWAPGVVSGIGCLACFVLSGNNSLQAYTDLVLASSGVSAVARGAALFAATQLAVAIVMAAGLIEVFGRRPLLVASAIGASVALRAFARASSAQAGSWTVVFACAFIGSVSLGVSTLSWLYASEVFPDAIRGQAMSAATFVFWGGSFAMIESFVPLANRIGIPGVLKLFSLFCALSAVFIYFFVVETKDKSLSEIQRRLEDATTPFQRFLRGGREDDDSKKASSNLGTPAESASLIQPAA